MDDIRETFNRFRKALKEADEKEKNSNTCAYTQQDEIMTNSLETCKAQFGADFSDYETPMLYYNADGDVTLSGSIPDLNNAQFQFRYKDPSGSGCYFWCKSLMISDENVTKLARINGVYKNWKKDLSTAEDIKPIALKNNQ